jgi:hypothetical protein
MVGESMGKLELDFPPGGGGGGGELRDGTATLECRHGSTVVIRPMTYGFSTNAPPCLWSWQQFAAEQHLVIDRPL